MKTSPTSSLLSFASLYTLILAAAPIAIHSASEWTTVLSALPINATTSNTTNPSLQLPHDPTQMRVYNTPTSLIFGKYTLPVSAFDLVGIIEKAQYEIVQSVIASPGDADKPIAQPTFEWRHGRLYVRMEHQLDTLTWKMMSEALHGLTEIGHEYGWFGYVFTVLDDGVGVVGSGSVGLGYT